MKNKKKTTYMGFSYSKNMANFEALHWNISSSINFLFLKSERRVDIFLEAVLQKKGDFCYAAEFATQFIKLIWCEKKSLDEIKPWDLCFCLFCMCLPAMPTHASTILQELWEKFSSHFSLRMRFFILDSLLCRIWHPSTSLPGKKHTSLAACLPSSFSSFFAFDLNETPLRCPN